MSEPPARITDLVLFLGTIILPLENLKSCRIRDVYRSVQNIVLKRLGEARGPFLKHFSSFLHVCTIHNCCFQAKVLLCGFCGLLVPPKLRGLGGYPCVPHVQTHELEREDRRCTFQKNEAIICNYHFRKLLKYTNK